MRIAIVDRVIFHYRVGFLSKLQNEYEIMVFHGESVSGSKVVNAPPPYPFPTRKMFTLSKRSKKNPLQIFYFNPGCVLRLIRWKPDLIVIDESNMINNILIYIYCRLFSKKYLFWGLGQVPGRKDSIYRKILTPIRKFVIRRASACLAYCKLSVNYFTTITCPHKVIVMPNSLDNEKVEKEIDSIREKDKVKLHSDLKIPPNAVVLLYVGALEKNKRLEVFIDTLEKFSEEKRNIHGLIIGGGPSEEYYHQYADRLGLKNCAFLGKIVQGVNIYFQIADIFILPGRGGLAINQALINGLPAICNTPADGTELDMIENDTNGILIESMDSTKLHAAIEKIISDDRISNMGLKSREVIDNKYNINVMVNVFKKVINRVNKTN
jgi:glycosyltransferase involved in cell wall biosynthesis